MDFEWVAVDVDDVILDFGGRVIKTVNKEYGQSLQLEDITSWNLNELLDPILGEDWWVWWEERSWLWADASAIDGAIGGLRTLHQRGHKIELLTAKPDWARAGLSQWLGKWQPYYDRITVGPARPAMNKAEWSSADILIDDKPSNCIEFVDAGRMAILFDRPHNQKESVPPPIPRAKNWGQVLTFMEQLEAILD